MPPSATAIETSLKQVSFDSIARALDFFVHAGNAGLHRALLPSGGDIPGDKQQTPPAYHVWVTGSESQLAKLMESWNEQSQPSY